jgi:dTDP-4-dehydrorhamnose 3,5-epimerase
LRIEATALPSVVEIVPRRFGDDRGWFSETWNRQTLRAQGLDLDFVQDNHSLSAQVRTIRGLHYQRPPHAQAKLVRVVRGRILDVAVDARVGSPTFGRWVGVELSAQAGNQLLVPVGCLHGFVTREPMTEVVYKCSDVYAPDCDGAVAWDDPELAIDWGVDPGAAVLSDKDRRAPRWADWQSPFVPEGSA